MEERKTRYNRDRESRGREAIEEGALPARLWPLSRYTFLRFPTAGGGPCFPFSPHRDTDKVTHPEKGQSVGCSARRVPELSLTALSLCLVTRWTNFSSSYPSSWIDCDRKKKRFVNTFSSVYVN